MMTKKILFFLTFLLCLTGGGQLWAQITVGYTEEIDGITVGARVLSNGNLDHLSIGNTPICGTNVDSQGSKKVYNNNTELTNTVSWRKHVSTDSYDDQQWVGYSLTVDEGYCLNISNVAAKILVADDTYNWKVVIENSFGTEVYSSSKQTTTKAVTAALADTPADLSKLSKLTGTITVKLYMYQGGTTKYFSINYLQLGVTVQEDTRSNFSLFAGDGGFHTSPVFVDEVASSKIITNNAFNISAQSGGNTINPNVNTNLIHISSSNTSILTIDNSSINWTYSTSDRQRVYFTYNIVGEGDATVKCEFEGDATYKPASTSVNVHVAKASGPTVYNSLPYTWDFANNSWESSKIQLNASVNWDSSTDYATNNYAIEAIDCYDIDMLKGLKLTAAANGITADWQNKKLTITGTIKLPDLLRGHRVSIVSSAQPSTVPANFTLKSTTYADGKYTVVYFISAGTTNPEIVFDNATDIYSIAVEKTRAELVLNTTESTNGTSSYLAANPPTLNLGTSQSWGNYCFDIIDGLVTATQTTPSPDYTVTITPAGILHARYGVEWASDNTTRLILTADAVGTARVSVAINPSGDHGYEVVSPYEFDVRVVQNAVPTKWEFENTGKWTTATAEALGDDGTNWQSGTAANEYKNKNKINGTELYVGETKMTETAGLYITAEKGAIQVNPTNGYVRIGNASRANIVIPNAVAEQTVTFKVKTATAGKECGIQAASSNLALISGTVAGDVSYYTFRVTNNGDIKFTQTSSDTDLFIYYIDLKAATPANTGLKFVHGSDDISNTKVNIVSGATGELDSYFTLANGGSVGWANVTVTVSPSSLITYDHDGTFTMGSGTGTATITARTTDGSVETGIAVLYVSVKAQPTVTLSANGPFSVDYGHDFNNNTSTVTGTSSEKSLTVKYKSSNERVATVDANGHVTCVGVGTATITAYTEETTDYLYAEASYDLTINQGNVVFRFEPSEIDLPLGKTITPYMNYDQQGQIDTNGLSFTVSKDGVVNTEKVASPREADKYLCKITSIDDASLVGESVIITAEGQVKGSSPAIYYYTTIKVNITAADACNFDWVNSSDIYIYEDTYLPIPRIAGNATGNNHFSNSNKNGGNGDEKGDNKRTESGNNYKYYWESGNHYDPLHAYVYEIKHDVITWNNNSSENTNYHLNEGVPDFYLTDASNAATDKGYILWAKSDNKAYGDTLLVYAKTEGIIKLHAKDSQNDTECTPITIHIMPKSTIYGSGGELETQINTISFPYTWDFTSNEDLSALDNSIYWDKENNNYYNAPLTMNVNFADGLDNGATNTKTHLAFLGATSNGEDHHILPWFKGLKIQLGNSKYNSKIHKIRISPYTSPGNSRLYLSGGTHTITLPQPGYINPATGFNEPESYKVFIKLHTTGSTEVELKAGVSNDSYKSFDKDATYTRIDANSDVILSKTVARGEQVSIGLADCNIYWIAMSTEAKNLSYFKHSNINLTYAAAAYSYPEDLDLSKSNEVNGATAYYASSFTKDNDAQGAYSNDPEQQYAVVMSPLSNLGTYVTKGTGMLLKYDNLSGIDVTKNDATIPFNMIANPRNVETYSAEETVTGDGVTNYLVGTGSSSPTITGHETIGSEDYTNFMMSAAYKYYTDITDVNTAQGDYRFDRDWSFYPVMNTGSVGPQKSYLHIPGNLYVNKEGKIVDIPASSRSYGRAADNDTPGAPASRGALSIVFDDDPSNGQGTTGISTVATETTVDSDAWYTLQGVRVNAPAKGGIYIYKGKKVVVK